jgi:hypothetical protein
MRYRSFDPPRKLADFEPIWAHWRSLGWQPIDKTEEREAIRDAWTAKFGKYGIWGADPVFRVPARTWDITPLYPFTGDSAEIEADFTMKMLGAFRRCVPKGERLLVIGHWQLQWYEFDPHGGITAAICDEWARSILPGEATHFIDKGLRFGTYGDWRGKITIFGREMFAALKPDPPREFFRVCRLVQRANP